MKSYLVNENALIHRNNESNVDKEIFSAQNVYDASCIASQKLLLEKFINNTDENVKFRVIPDTVCFIRRASNTSLSSFQLLSYMQVKNDRLLKSKIQSFVKKNKTKRIGFYGAGLFARCIFEDELLSNLDIVGFVDQNP